MANLECGSAPPTGTLTGPCSGSDTSCALEILDCNTAPAWDLYDNDPCNPEHALFSSNLCEYTDISGFLITYRFLLHDDERLYGEDPNASLSEPFHTKVNFDPTEESSVLNAWGISFDDTMQYMMIPKTMFTRDARDVWRGTPELSGGVIRPNAGDVIVVEFNNKKYEITDVGATGTIFNAKKFVWEFILKPYRHSYQSPEHNDVNFGWTDDPFATLSADPSGNFVEQNNYTTVVYGDNEYIEKESDKIDDYRDIKDPDKGAFGY